jgi:hypothetical protein
MEKITLTIKDKSKLNFILELLKQFSFVELLPVTQKKANKGSFFESAGLLKSRKISAKNYGKKPGH